MNRRFEPGENRARLARLWALAVIAGFACAASVLFAQRAITESLTGCSGILLPRAAVTGERDVSGAPHLFLTATLRQARQAIAGQCQQGQEHGDNAKQPHVHRVVAGLGLDKKHLTAQLIAQLGHKLFIQKNCPVGRNSLVWAHGLARVFCKANLFQEGDKPMSVYDSLQRLANRVLLPFAGALALLGVLLVPVPAVYVVLAFVPVSRNAQPSGVVDDVPVLASVSKLWV